MEVHLRHARAGTAAAAVGYSRTRQTTRSRNMFGAKKLLAAVRRGRDFFARDRLRSSTLTANLSEVPDVAPPPPHEVPQRAVHEAVELSLMYKSTLGNGFFNHVTMAAAALARIGGTTDEVRERTAKGVANYQRKYGMKRIESAKPETLKIVESHWQKFLNKDGSFEAEYRDVVLRDLQQNGKHAVISKYLSHFTRSVHSKLHHGIIRLAYADVIDSEEETAAALASWACNHTAFPGEWMDRRPRATGTSRSVTDAMLDMRRTYAADDSPKVYLSKVSKHLNDGRFIGTKIPKVDFSDEDDATLMELFRSVVELYLQKPNVYTLHMVTGLHALYAMKRYFLPGDFAEALDTHWVSFATIYWCLKCPRFERQRAAPEPVSWEVLVRKAIASGNDHNIKFVDTCMELSRDIPNVPFQLAATTALKNVKPSG
mmetsp:Transcript_7100/g.18152  ORF Transcript_7100/g.18152 Transcript_7100/m.18152 type:complete len:429 (-) Transcript_7100:166-1452(-)